MTAATTRIAMIALWLPKPGSPRSEWEDGCAFSPGTGRFAVADGASTGSHSREWAYTLVERWIATEVEVWLGGDDPDALVGERFARWLDDVRSSFDPDAAEFRRSNAPEWVQSLARGRGSHATFLGGHVDTERVTVVGVGDCCMFHVDRTGAVSSFPLSSAAEFGTAPALVASVPDLARSHPALQRTTRAVGAGDVVYVASDAIAAWLIDQLDQPEVWSALARLGPTAFERLHRDLVADRRIRSDDVTLLRIEVG